MHILDTLAHLFHPRRSNNHRPRILHPEGFLVLAMLAVGFSLFLHSSTVISTKAGEVLGFSSSITAAQVVTQTNAERAKVGLPPLTVNDKLNQAATMKGQHMFSHQYWAHVAPDGTQPWQFFKNVGYHYNTAGENLARDFDNTGDMVAAWMASPTHRANMINSRYTEIGVAVINGTLLGTETTLVVQLFGRPQTQVAQILPDEKVKAAQDVAPAGEAQPAGAPQSELAYAQAQPTIINEGGQKAEILGSGVMPITSLKVPPLFSPLQLTKSFFLAIIIMIVLTLMYDAFVMRNQNTVRLVGKNFAHLLLFCVVAFLLILFKGGIVQ